MENKKVSQLTTKSIEKRFNILRTVLAILIALVIAFFLILSVSDSPIDDFLTLLIGPLMKKSRMITILSKAAPLLFTGTAVCLIYQAGQINIAAEGAFFAGCVAATIVGIFLNVPPFVHIILCLFAAAIAGAIVMGIPGILHVKYDVVTIVSALMINYVSLYLGLYIILNPLRDPNAGFEASFSFKESAMLPKMFGNQRLHIGILLGVAVVIFGAVLLNRSKLGFDIRTVGANRKFAKYSGINVDKTIVTTSLLAGAISGVGGAVEILGNYSRFVYDGFTNHGWDGIMIAVLCRNNPKLVPIGAIFLAYLKTSSDALNMTSNIPPEIIDVIQAIIIIFVAAERFLSNWEHKKIVENASKNAELKEEAI